MKAIGTKPRLATSAVINTGRRQRNAEAAYLIGARADIFGQAHHDRETAIPLEYLACLPPADGDGDHFLHIADIKAKTCQRHAIRRDLKHGQTSHLFHRDIGRAIYAFHDTFYRLPYFMQLIEIIAEHLDRHVGAHAGQQFVKPHLDRLGEFIIIAGNDRLIPRYDRPHTLFYLDPPYWGCTDDYGRNVFSETDFERLSDLLKAAKGRFILSINDVPEIRELFSWASIEPVDLNYRISGKATAAKELVIRGRC